MKLVLAFMLAVVLLSGCVSDADMASQNLSKAADMFEVDRRIVFFNGITDKYILVVEGKCSLGNFDAARELSVTCKIGKDKYVKHFLGLSDNVSFFSEQVDPVGVNVYNYRVIFKPASVIPEIELATPKE